MNRTHRSLAIATAISISFYSAVYYWYLSNKPKSSNYGDEKPIAFVSEINEDVHRRPTTRMLWQLLAQGEPLYPGEAIRTSKQGEIRIQFNDSERYLDLEPESMIVITQSANNEISLDLMDGNIFVGQGENAAAGGPALTLNSEGGKVDLSTATAQLSKGIGSKLDVQVLKGTARVDGKEFDSSQGLKSIEILSPSLDRPFYINPESPQPVSFQWKGLPANSIVTLWAGKNRKELKALSQIKDPSETSLTQKMGLGKHFFKLVATDPASQTVLQESGTYRFEIAGRYAPTQLSPQADSTVTGEVSFQWTRPEQVQSITLEVAKDPGFKEKVFSEQIENNESFSKELAKGHYYWRVSSHFENIEQAISSKVLHFRVSNEVKAPIVISWQNDRSPAYYIEKPEATLTWATEQKEQVTSWRLKLAENAEELDTTQALQFDTKETHVKAQVQKPGRYIAMVEALDDKQNVIAKSEVKHIEISPLPLLKSPLFQPEGTQALNADTKGNLDLQWNEVEGAKEYGVTMVDLSGKEIKKGRFRKTSASMRGLMPGEYKVQVYAIDQHGRESEKVEPRSVNVSDMSGLQAPKLKKVKVK